MAQASRKDDIDARKVACIDKFIDNCEKSSTVVVKRWQQNYDMFVSGSRFEGKKGWQSQFSINKFANVIRSAHGELINTIVNNPDWMDIVERTPNNTRAALLKRPIKKIVEYYLDRANFRRHASTFILNSLISMGSLYVGWKEMLIQNPEYVAAKTRKLRQEEMRRLAKVVANPSVESEHNASAITANIEQAIDDTVAMLQGEESAPKEDIPEYLQYGCIEFRDLNHENIFWETNVAYMEDSAAKAWRELVTESDLKLWAKQGYISKSKIKDLPERKRRDKEVSSRLRNTNIMRTPNSPRDDLVELTYYFGPLIIDGEIKKDAWFCLVANGSRIIKEGDYPYWEPPGHKTPVVNMAVRQIPYRATGAGIGDNVYDIQRQMDSNWHLVNDTFRFGIAGINVVNVQKLVDKGQLDEGIEPGKIIEARDNPKAVFERISLTDNLENQVHPMQTILQSAIEEGAGINDLMSGGNNLRSRTTAAETNARMQGSLRNVNTIALDLEQNFLIPVLEKVLARVLQFGLEDIQRNPDLIALLDEAELYELTQLSEEDKISIVNHFFKFKINGFSARQTEESDLMRMNELLQIANSGGPLSQLIDLRTLLKHWMKLMKLDKDDALILKDAPQAQIEAENAVLMGNHIVYPDPNDNDELHLQLQGPLAQSPYATPALQQHVAMHQQQMQQKQMQQQGGQGEPPIQ